jgi:hypothetical protein
VGTGLNPFAPGASRSGLQILCVNLALGNLVALVGDEAASYRS